MTACEFVEYGVELTWPDGGRATDLVDDLESAEHRVEWHARHRSICTARIVQRVHTISEWHENSTFGGVA